MVAGATTISGGFKISDTAAIENFIETIVTATVSGASVFTYPDANSGKVYVGFVEQRN